MLAENLLRIMVIAVGTAGQFTEEDVINRKMRRFNFLIAPFWFVLIFLTTAFLCLDTSSALADLKLCNNTSSRVGIAIGYKDKTGWATEGWWNVASNTCETLLKGNLIARFYYIHAIDYDRGGEWGGSSFMCAGKKAFTIRGVEKCVPRGFKRTGFFEVDTREERDWTVRLTDPTSEGGDKGR